MLVGEGGKASTATATSGLGLAQERDRQLGVDYDVLRHRTEQQCSDDSVPARPHDDLLAVQLCRKRENGLAGIADADMRVRLESGRLDLANRFAKRPHPLVAMVALQIARRHQRRRAATNCRLHVQQVDVNRQPACGEAHHVRHGPVRRVRAVAWNQNTKRGVHRISSGARSTIVVRLALVRRASTVPTVITRSASAGFTTSAVTCPSYGRNAWIAESLTMSSPAIHPSSPAPSTTRIGIRFRIFSTI